MKCMIVPNKNYLSEYEQMRVDCYLLPLKDYSVSYQENYSIEEIINIKNKNQNSEIFVVINKVLYDEDLEKIKVILQKLENLSIQGVFFYDLAILEWKKTLNLAIPLVWNATHMVTNSKTCNYYFDQSVEYAVISGELEKNEIFDLIANTKIKLLYTLLSKPVVAHSKRKLLTNYSKTNKKQEKSELIIHEKVGSQDYLVKETEAGSSFFYQQIPNHYSILKDLQVEYIIMNESYISHDLFKYLLIQTQKFLKKEISFEEMKEDAERLLGNHAPFLENKTIYRVKKEEK